MTEKELLAELCAILTDLVKEINKIVALQIVLIRSIQTRL